MPVWEENTTGYGLRHIKTGKLIRIERDDEQFASIEYSLSLQDSRDSKLFVLPTMREVAALIGGDDNRHYASKQLPYWNGINLRHDIMLVRIDRNRVFDGPIGSDPIEDHQTVNRATMPKLFDGDRLEIRRGVPTPIIRSHFGVQIVQGNRDGVEIAVIEPGNCDQGIEDSIGSYVHQKGRSDTGRILALAELPDDFPIGDRVQRRVDDGTRLLIALLDVSAEQDIVVQPLPGYEPNRETTRALPAPR